MRLFGTLNASARCREPDLRPVTSLLTTDDLCLYGCSPGTRALTAAPTAGHSRTLASLSGLLLLSACTSTDIDLATDDPAEVFDSQTTRIVVEVDYQQGAEPYVGGANDTPAWDFFEENARALLGSSTAAVEVPKTLEAMQRMADVNDGVFTVGRIIELSNAHLDTVEGEGTVVYHVLFLNGFFADSDGEQRGVLGVSISGTRVIAMFKPVIASSSFLPIVRNFVEQSTLVHEYGHAVGLVNAGVPLTSDHHDAENGAHCSNRDCVMYYLNESISDLVTFIDQWRSTGNAVLFGAECLQDVRSLHTAAQGSEVASAPERPPAFLGGALRGERQKLSRENRGERPVGALRQR